MISELFPNIFLEHAFIKSIIEKLFTFMSCENFQVIISVLNIFRNITDGLKEDHIILSDASILLSKLVFFYEKMLENFHGHNKEFSEKCVLSIMNCLIRVQSRETILLMTNFLISKYETYYTQNIDDI